LFFGFVAPARELEIHRRNDPEFVELTVFARRFEMRGQLQGEPMRAGVSSAPAAGRRCDRLCCA
jgi:hypothetical protein